MNIIKSYIFIEKMCYDTPPKVQEVMVQNWTHKQSIIVLHSKKKKKKKYDRTTKLERWNEGEQLSKEQYQK